MTDGHRPAAHSPPRQRQNSKKPGDDQNPPQLVVPMEPRGEAIGGTPPQRSERRFGVLGPQRIDRDGVGFASHENLAEVVPYLNRSLNDLGYPGPLELEAPSVGDLARVANVLFLILRDRQQDAASREQWGRERRRLAADKARAETFYERARAELAAKDEELANSLAKSDGRVDKERRRLDDATAECASLKQRLLKSQQRCATLENESRRREKEREKLSARLEKFVNDRRRDVANATPVGVMRVTTGGARRRGARRRTEGLIRRLERRERHVPRPERARHGAAQDGRRRRRHVQSGGARRRGSRRRFAGVAVRQPGAAPPDDGRVRGEDAVADARRERPSRAPRRQRRRSGDGGTDRRPRAATNRGRLSSIARGGARGSRGCGTRRDGVGLDGAG